MFLKSLALKNIRSYIDERIEFPSGSLLIAGDIGSGKSTILLAIDFALFGARPNELPASSLLRNGAKRGEVVLEFTIDGKEVEIKRVLEKKANSVAQTAGYIAINGTRKDLMSMGLKSIVFELLGYPAADIKAGKSLIYRYTVYTPQEQMKQILMMKADERLNTIRSIFNIDKYKRIRENAKAVSRELKKTASHLEGIAYDLKEKQEKRALLESQMKSMLDDLKKKETVHAKIKGNLENKKKEKAAIQDAMKKLVTLMREASIKKTRLESDEKMHQSYRTEIDDAAKRVEKMQAENDFEQKIRDLEKEIGELAMLKEKAAKADDDIRHIEQKMTESYTRKNTSDEIIRNILALSECPTCKQQVPDQHKERIRETETKKAENFEKIIALHKKTLDELRAGQKDIRLKVDAIHDKEKVLVRLRSDFRAFNEIKDGIEKKNLKAKELLESIGLLKTAIIGIEKDIEPLKDTEERSERIEKEFEILNGEYTITLAQLEKARQQVSSADAEKSALEKEITLKMKAKEESVALNEITDWMKEYFLQLMENMEKHIMLSILHDFDMLFREWFNMLIDDDTLQARIDQEFTPVIEQNAYETSYNYLSGGEKTSIALAYRLALNKVINNMSEEIKTKNLLILDEPTDGFSSEQLDKVRDVLIELNLAQTIIVSHEEKIEGFVEKTIRVEKKEHVSHIV
ncbi:MAG: AAA family ATPase [archaeon]